MTKNWKDVRPELKHLYLTQRKPLEEVRKLMKDQHGFDASLRAYKNKIDEWGWKKYKKPSRSGALVATQGLSQDEICASVSVDVASNRTRLQELEENIEHQKALVENEKISLLSLRESVSRDRSDETNVECIARCDENIAKIERTLKSLEGILTSAAIQISPPAGFASCWKQQPMMLEDAHGTFIPIPLDIVVSWQIFDDVLQSHFRILPGVKKVAKREYIIENSATCTKFSRDSPWTSLCKAGLKIDMSMIFKDTRKTSVVCPKCDTISNEPKGVMVQCKNSSCKMLFRTEEEEDRHITTSQIRRSQPRSPISITSSPLLSSISCQDEEEDKPGLFKRVIMRIAKNIPMITDQARRRPYGDNLEFPYSTPPQQLEADSYPDISSPSLSFWGLIDQTSPHSSFRPGSPDHIPGTVALYSEENQHIREVDPLTRQSANLAHSRMTELQSPTFDTPLPASISMESIPTENKLPAWNCYNTTDSLYPAGPEIQAPLSSNPTNPMNFLMNSLSSFPNTRPYPAISDPTNSFFAEIYHDDLLCYLSDPPYIMFPPSFDSYPPMKTSRLSRVEDASMSQDACIPTNTQQYIQPNYDVTHNISTGLEKSGRESPLNSHQRTNNRLNSAKGTSESSAFQQTDVGSTLTGLDSDNYQFSLPEFHLPSYPFGARRSGSELAERGIHQQYDYTNLGERSTVQPEGLYPSSSTIEQRYPTSHINLERRGRRKSPALKPLAGLGWEVPEINIGFSL